MNRKIAKAYPVAAGCGQNVVRLGGVLAQVLLALAIAPLARAEADEPDGRRALHFFGFCASKPDDPPALRQRGVNAVNGVRDRLSGLGYETLVLLGSKAKGADARASEAGRVTCSEVIGALDGLHARLGTNDTVVLYSHTHGVKRRDDRPNWPGGMLLDAVDKGARDPRPGLNWADYAEQVLKLPAKTVVVLAMACHSGGLAEYLNTDTKARRLWQERRAQGRDFVVITSQNAQALSNPRHIGGEVINPFTYAVLRAFEGAADGYPRGDAAASPDGRITLGELSQYLVDEAKKHKRADDAANDPDPQVTGSFDPGRVVVSLRQEAGRSFLPPAGGGRAGAAAPRIEAFELNGGVWRFAADGKPLSGLLIMPEGEGPFPAVVLSHGLGGSAQSMMRTRGAELARAGFVCIATDYTHAGTDGGRGDRSGVDFTQAGARPENIRRGLACLEILRQRKDVDPARIALYGHSMGAFLTIALAAAAPGKVASAAITAGGVVPEGVDAAAPTAAVAARVRAPFLILHGTADTTVQPERSELLKRTLDASGVKNERRLFEGVGHGLPLDCTEEVGRLVREWFARHGAQAETPGAAGRNQPLSE